MTPEPAAAALTALLESPAILTDRNQRLERVREHLFSHSRELRQPDFRTIRASDLQLLFDAYDREFFSEGCRAALDGRPLSFRLSRRMSRAAGNTKRVSFRDGREAFEIGAATTTLFESFAPGERTVLVCGLECATRLDALQRILEHELIHLAELLCWRTSRCSAPRFQSIAARLFDHRSHTHSLITRREQAAVRGVGSGARVTFLFEGTRLNGRVHRITKRATVLVEDPAGEPYSDGRRYRCYYVPIDLLESAG